MIQCSILFHHINNSVYLLLQPSYYNQSPHLLYLFRCIQNLRHMNEFKFKPSYRVHAYQQSITIKHVIILYNYTSLEKPASLANIILYRIT